MTQKTSRAALDSEILEWMRETPWQHDETRFDSLALRGCVENKGVVAWTRPSLQTMHDGVARPLTSVLVDLLSHGLVGRQGA